MRQPVIGITANHGKNVHDLPTVYVLRAYVDAVQQAGGAPVVIPNSLINNGWEALYERLDGILFSGGGDIAVEHFHGADHPRVDEVDASRDAIEFSMLRAAAKDGKPFLGICRGAQVANVALGGTLYTHLADQLPNALDHAYPGNRRTTIVHPVNVDEASRSAEIFGQTLLQVNSLHHQGLKDIAPGLNVTARAPDGLAEMVELSDHPYGIAVQWHPEWLTDQQPTRNLFKSFIDSCAK